MTDTRYAARVDHRMVCLTPDGRNPRADKALLAAAKLLVVGKDSSGLIIRTGCHAGYVDINVLAREREPSALADCQAGWEIGEERTAQISGALTLMSPLGYDPVIDDVFSPRQPGLHRVRVLARGRAENRGLTTEAPTGEQYEVTLWPVDAHEPALQFGDDGVF